MSELSSTPEPPYYAVIFTEHREAQRLGRESWYEKYSIRIALVEEVR